MNWAIAVGCAVLIAVLRKYAMSVKWSGVKLVVWAVIILLAMAAGWAFFQTDLGRWLVDGAASLVGTPACGGEPCPRRPGPCAPASAEPADAS